MDKHFQQVVSVHIKVAFVVEKKSLLYQFKVDRGIFVGLNVWIKKGPNVEKTQVIISGDFNSVKNFKK